MYSCNETIPCNKLILLDEHISYKIGEVTSDNKIFIISILRYLIKLFYENNFILGEKFYIWCTKYDQISTYLLNIILWTELCV